MEETDLKQIYKIEKDRLYKIYERFKSQFSNLPQTQIVAKFLINQSIGTSFEEILNILKYFKDSIIEGRNILDFAFEWIRAQKIYLEYKKYLGKAEYPKDNLNLAIDDCISLFFLKYDEYIRRLLKEDVKEFEISALYEIFFSPYDTKNLNIEEIIGKYNIKVPTVFFGVNRVITNIITIRSGLSQIIEHDLKSSSKKDRKLKIKKQ